MTPVHYSISAINPNSHLFSVSLTFNTQLNKTYTLALPAWLPGSYMVRDFAKNITEISAHNEQQLTVPLTAIDKQTWQITANSDQVTVNYQVFAFDLS